jgi:hypothetical protein
MICKRAKRPYNAIELLHSDGDGAWVRCKICGRKSYRRSRAARHRAMKPDLSTLPSATDDNQLGAYLCRLWDEQRAGGFRAGKWCAELGRFVTLAEWEQLQKMQKGMQK